MPKHIAVYLRVSSAKQDMRSQEPDLERWAAAQDQPAIWYRDTFTGRTMNRPGWQTLEAAIRAGEVSQVCVWRIDRLGRTARGLTALFEDLQARHVGLVSLRDGIDLSTPAGRLMANVIASVAQYEVEVRSERVLAGQARARANGKRWGGSNPGRRIKVTIVVEETIVHLFRRRTPVAQIARTMNLTKRTVYRVLQRRKLKSTKC